MPAPSPSDTTSAPWRSVAWLALGFALLRVIYLAFLSPYELAADEAHYWEWARRPALSYYSKGPGIAWTILAGTSLLGDTELGVRLFAALFSGVTTFAVGLTAARFATPATARSAAITAGLLFNALPAYQVTSVLMTIDGPYLACWALAMASAWRMLRRADQFKAWSPADAALLGLALGLGFLYKYTVLLFIPGLLLHLAIQHRSLRQLRGAPLAGLLGLAVFIACISPVLIWNHLEGWPTVKHLLGHANLHPAGPACLRPAMDARIPRDATGHPRPLRVVADDPSGPKISPRLAWPGHAIRHPACDDRPGRGVLRRLPCDPHARVLLRAVLQDRHRRQLAHRLLPLADRPRRGLHRPTTGRVA